MSLVDDTLDLDKASANQFDEFFIRDTIELQAALKPIH
jgi:hypothetical protein